jgi:rubrerythrin
MPTLTPTAASGARTSPAEMTYVNPDHLMPPEEQKAFLADSDLNGPFVADLLSDMCAHERCGAQLYRSLAGRTNNPMLKKKYEHFGEETTTHVGILETLIERLGGDPMYVSPAARATTKAGTALLESTFLLTGSIDLMTQELVMLDAVLLAEAKDHANWGCLAALVEHLPDGEIRDAFTEAVETVQPQEDEHFGWASDTRCKMISAQATSRATQVVGEAAETVISRVRNWLD